MADLDAEQFRAVGHQLIDWVADFRTSIAARPVRPVVLPGSIRDQLPGSLPQAPSKALGDALTTLLDDVIVPGSLQWQHPGFFGYFPANASLLSLLGDIASGAVGSQGMLWSTAPAATELEQSLLDNLADALGLGERFTFGGGGGGVMQDSASSAALVALLAGLHRTTPDWRVSGVAGTERIYVTAETHSSVAKAALVAGLGSISVRTVPFSPGTLSMSPPALQDMLVNDISEGLQPVLVCPTIGTTGTGAVDPVKEIARVAHEHNAWVHVDAAWAGVAALCPEFRWVTDGVEEADSFCTDAHKWLYTSFDASLMWVRDGRALPEALSITPEYLRNSATESGEVVDYRDWQVPLGRRARILKLWSVLNGAGLEGLQETIRKHVGFATEFAEWIRGESRFNLVVEPSLALVCFQVIGRNGLPDDELGRATMDFVNDSGRAFLTHTTVDGQFVIRVAVGATSTERTHIEELQTLLRDAVAAYAYGSSNN